MVTTTTTSSNTTTKQLASFKTQVQFQQGTMRSRTLVVSGKKLQPNTTMNFYLNTQNINGLFTPCLRLEIAVNTPGKYTGCESGQQTDNLVYRATPLGTHDNIMVGEIITVQNVSTGPAVWADQNMTWSTGAVSMLQGYPTSITSGASAIVIADETVSDKTTNANRRFLYVANYKEPVTNYSSLSGWLTAIKDWFQGMAGFNPTIIAGNTIKGLTSQILSTVISVSHGGKDTNSLGNIYGTISIPHHSFPAGNNTILISDSVSSDPLSAKTFAATKYNSNGAEFDNTTNIMNQQQTVTTITNTTNNLVSGTLGQNPYFNY